jgi:hypothetical protein
MPFNQPATATYVGFWPVESAGTVVQCNPYLVSSSEASDINIGDVVCQTSLNTVRVITGAYTPTSSMATVGVAASRVAANGGSTAALITVDSSRVLLVYDGPNQIFAGCDTTSGSVGPQTGMFKNYSILATGAIGSTGPNSSLARSVQAISGVTATAAGAIKIVGMHPCEMGVWTSVSAGTACTSTGVRKWMFIFESGVTLQSTQLSAMSNTTS